MSAKILASENYMDDAFSSQFSNCMKALKRKVERDKMSVWGPVEMPVLKRKDESDEMSVWGPVEMPVRGKSTFTMHQYYPTKMFKSEDANENAIIGVNNSLSSPKEKVIRHDPIENYLRKLLMATDNSEKSCLHYCQQVPHNGINNIAPAQNVENIQVSSHCHQKINVERSLGSNLLGNSRLLSDVKYNEEPLVENINSDHLEIEKVSSKFKNGTKHIHEDANPGNSSKNLEYDASAKADVRTGFANWCENRKREYKSSPNLTQFVVPKLTVMMTEEQDLSKRKSIVSKNEYEDVLLEPEKQKMFEYAASVENSKDNNYSVDKVFVCKTNLSHENDELPIKKSIEDLKQILINAKCKTSEKEKIDCSKFDVTKYQKVPEITDEYISENNPQFSVELSNDKKNAASFKKQHHDINPKINVVEKVLDINTKETTCANKNSGQNESSELKKRYKKEPKFNRTYEIPPRFRNNMNGEKNIGLEKLSVPKKVQPGNKLLNEDSKTFQKKKKNIDSDIPVSHESMLKDPCYLSKEKTPLCITIADERCEKNFEFISDAATLSRKKKTFPKLSADIPDVDSGPKELHYSADALNIILRYFLTL